MGCLRAGYTVFAISPRNSSEAVAHLLSQTDVAFVFVSQEPSMVALAEAALKILQDSGHAVPMGSMPSFEDLSFAASKDDFAQFPQITYDMDAPALILHSSG